LDFTIERIPGEQVWLLTDLLGRSLGTIRMTADGRFTITPADLIRGMLSRTNPGPYLSLDEALNAVEKRLQGVGRHA
jgi:hypothetical protein